MFTFMNHDGRNYLVPTSWQGKYERTVMHGDGEGAKVKVLGSYIVICSGLAKKTPSDLHQFNDSLTVI